MDIAGMTDPPRADASALPDIARWIGRTEVATGAVPATMARMVHATLGRPDTRCPQAGETMPPLWHWYAFPPDAGTRDLGADGHPRLGGFLPPLPYDRRMWAGGALRFHGDLRVGEEIERRTTITGIEEKRGATGGMVFVTLEHRIASGRGLAVEETQSIVYLPIPPRFAPPPKKPAPTEGLVLDRAHPLSAALLFRYSAITFNAHRIHYDLAYTREVEHYPGLVVHGPLQAALLMDAAVVWKGRAPARFAFRGVHPLFSEDGMRLRAVETPQGGLELCTMAEAGHLCMTATAEWED